MNETVTFKLKTKKLSKWKMFLRTRKSIPKTPDIRLEQGECIYISDADAVVGESYLTETLHVVKILDKQDIFMGSSLLVEYSNKAVRWVDYYTRLFQLEK